MISHTIQIIPFKAAICLLLILTFGSCSIAPKIPKSKYIEIDPDETKNYFITLKNGTKYNASKLEYSDSNLTIIEPGKSRRTVYTDLTKDELPLSVLLEDIDYIRASKISILLTSLVGLGAIALIGIVIFVSTWELELGDPK
jgi:hypothetical protein